MRRLRLAVMIVAGFSALASPAVALVLQAPLGGGPVLLPQDRIACNPLPEGWTTDALRRRLRPPAQERVGTERPVLLAPSWAACANGAEPATLVTTGPLPVIDPASAIVSLDAGRLEFRGDGLEGVRVAWKTALVTGSDVCLKVTKDKGHDLCVVDIDETLPADPRRIELTWAPAGGRTEGDVATYDQAGVRLSEDQRRLPVARVLLSRVFPLSHVVDMARAEGQVELLHPEAVSSVDCGGARCDVTPTGIVVRVVPAAATTVTVRVKLAPRVFLAHGDAVDAVSQESLSILRCPLTFASGPPIRGVDDLKVLVRLDKACGRDADDLRWTASGEAAEVARTETLDDGVYVLLRVGRVGERLTIVASRPEDGSVLAVANERTWDVPPLRTSLSLPAYGEIGFIPKNRDAFLSVAPVGASGTLVPVSIPGAYTVERRKDGFYIRGVYTSGGYTALRFAYRTTAVPAAFADATFATLVDPVERPIRDANVPAPLGASSLTPRPIVDLVCSIGGKPRSIPPGTSPHIPFAARESCRLVIHRERIAPENGEQRVDIDVSVTSVSGADRSDGKLTERLVLRHGAEQDVIWLRGAKEQFDRMTVHVTHVIDESQYPDVSTNRIALPSAQWTIVTESANFKFYAMAAIPASLYRFSKDPENLGTGPLALNFGVLSRLTWLDGDGHEGLVGLEAGAMGMGLETDKTRQLALVTGLGVSIPLGNANQPTQASVNIHAWSAYSVGTRTGQLQDAAGNTTTVTLNPWAFVFGPSITIGNVGTFL